VDAPSPSADSLDDEVVEAHRFGLYAVRVATPTDASSRAYAPRR